MKTARAISGSCQNAHRAGAAENPYSGAVVAPRPAEQMPGALAFCGREALFQGVSAVLGKVRSDLMAWADIRYADKGVGVDPWEAYRVRKEDVFHWGNCQKASELLGTALCGDGIEVTAMQTNQLPLSAMPYCYSRSSSALGAPHVLLHAKCNKPQGSIIIDATFLQFVGFLKIGNREIRREFPSLIPLVQEALSQRGWLAGSDVLIFHSSELHHVADAISAVVSRAEAGPWQSDSFGREEILSNFTSIWQLQQYAPVPFCS